MISAILGVLAALKPFLTPLIAFLAGWLFPSPLQKAIDQQGKVKDVEDKASSSRGDMSGMDGLP